MILLNNCGIVSWRINSRDTVGMRPKMRDGRLVGYAVIRYRLGVLGAC
jgi:hypothetical protein